VGHPSRHFTQGGQLVRLNQLGVEFDHFLIGPFEAIDSQAGGENRRPRNGQKPERDNEDLCPPQGKKAGPCARMNGCRPWH
jgi:hypothetical protein